MSAVIDAGKVKELREKTGAGMMDCKKALAETGGDFAKAIEHLRKKGIASAEKKAGRAARQGLVCACVKGVSAAGLVEVNCETDFVARTPFFCQFVKGLAEQVADGKAVDHESVKEVTAKVGENVKIGRFVRFAGAPGARTVLGTYIHMGGKIGVLVELGLEKTPTDGAAIAVLAEDMAMQVAAARPLYVRRSEVPAEVQAKEKEIYHAQVAESKKPEAVVEKIIEGKLDKYFQQACLEEQAFIKDPSGKLPVRDHVKAVASQAGTGAVTILRFARFEVGEDREAEPPCGA